MRSKRLIAVASVMFAALQVTQVNALGHYRLQTMFTGADKCLDIINDGQNNKLTMA